MKDPSPAKNLTGRSEAPAWNPADPAGSLAAIHQAAVKDAVEAVGWYMRKKSPRALASQALRLAAIGFATLGGLIPLCRAVPYLDRFGDFSLLGYICFALAAACVAVDHFFGLSSAWMRYITSAFAIQKALAELQMDWSIQTAALAGKAPSAEQVQQQLTRVKEFRLAVLGVVERETQAWVAEFQANLLELDKLAKSQLEVMRSGMIDLTVTNGDDADGELVVSMDGAEKARFQGSRRQLAAISPGPHALEVKGTVKGKAVTSSGAVVVPPGAVGALSLTLPAKAG